MANEEEKKQPTTASIPEQEQLPPIDTKKIFFNVPGKNRMTGPMIQSTQSVVEPTEVQPGEVPDSAKSFFQKYKTLIYVAVGSIVVFAVGGYFIYSYLLGPAEQIIVPVSSAPPTPQQKPKTTFVPPTNVSMSADWMTKYFNGAECKTDAICGDKADPDRDGLDNVTEFKTGTDPNNPDSDKDGLSDGDETNIFESSPLQGYTTGSSKFSDADDAKNGYDVKTPGKKFTEARLTEIKAKIKQSGLHSPSIVTLGDTLVSIYGMNADGTEASTSNEQQTNVGTQTLPEGTDMSPSSVLDRDAQRQTTIKKIGIALIKYKNDVGTFPVTESFNEMATKIKPYNLVATSSADPINQSPYVYSYAPSIDAKTFTLTYYSETQKLPIKYTSEQALKDFGLEDAALRDEQRMQDVESLKSALLAYSSTKIAGNQNYVFPPVTSYKSELVPRFLSALPRDPKSQTDYEYLVGENFDSFTLKAILESPSNGTTGYLCNQEECRKY